MAEVEGGPGGSSWSSGWPLQHVASIFLTTRAWWTRINLSRCTPGLEKAKKSGSDKSSTNLYLHIVSTLLKAQRVIFIIRRNQIIKDVHARLSCCYFFRGRVSHDFSICWFPDLFILLFTKPDWLRLPPPTEWNGCHTTSINSICGNVRKQTQVTWNELQNSEPPWL